MIEGHEIFVARCAGCGELLPPKLMVDAARGSEILCCSRACKKDFKIRQRELRKAIRADERRGSL